MTEEPQAIRPSFKSKQHRKSGEWPYINIDDITNYVTAFFYNVQHLEEFARAAGINLRRHDQELAYQMVTLPNGEELFLGSHDTEGEYWTLQHISDDAQAANDTAVYLEQLLSSTKSSDE